MKKYLISLSLLPMAANALPSDFIHLDEVAPSIIQEMRYAGYHNFIGRPIVGYRRATCILSRQAAKKLAAIQSELKRRGYSLKVYDCYRPQRAVNDFWQWSRTNQVKMKAEFYPREEKKDLFKKGYIAKHSGHSRGSTVDLTIVSLKELKQSDYTQGMPLKACYQSKAKRFNDNSIDMGTGYDCLDESAAVFYDDLPKKAKQNRLWLRRLMLKNGFAPYAKEWWHFTLKNEPFNKRYFNFPVS